jgi:hypothetical protein
MPNVTSSAPHVIAGLAVLSLGTISLADSIFFTVHNAVSPETPLTLVTAWAQFDEAQYAFASGAFEVHASEAEFNAPYCLLDGPGAFEGWTSPDGDEVTGIRVGQLHGLGGIFADTSNPIALWQATWSTDDFTPRTVDLWTGLPTDWHLYVDESGEWQNFVDQVEPGFGTITVVPGPGAVSVVVGFGALAVRRSRRP